MLQLGRSRLGSRGRERSSCELCGQEPVAWQLGVCARCLREERPGARERALAAHEQLRREWGLPGQPPRSKKGIPCRLCANACVLGEGEVGYCGLRLARGGQLLSLGGTARRGLLQWYRDPLPTNCVAMWACGAQGLQGHNLAVFYGACSLNCLNCQNWHFRDLLPSQAERAAARAEQPPAAWSVRGRWVSAWELAACAEARTRCVCFFGGDPAVQMAHALLVGKLLARQGVRICWETNGLAHPKLMAKAVELSLRSGGTVKFDLKAWHEPIHVALTGRPNQRTLQNFAAAARRAPERPWPPLVVASTLLVPWYVDEIEVAPLAAFVAQFGSDIPYALLAFAPAFALADLPCTTREHAERALRAVRSAGLKNVRLGNEHLLS